MAARVAVLGCGPAGLLAAHAVARAGCEVIVYSDKVKSKFNGAQYVHDPIPGLRLPTFLVTFAKLGTREGYAEKVYGDPTARCSWDSFPEGEQEAWPMQEMYDQLWDKYEDLVVQRHLTRSDISSILSNADMVVSSIPAPGLCMYPDRHSFTSQQVGFVPHAALEVQGDDMVVYNGNRMDHWYRSSRIRGVEFTETTDPKRETVFSGIKPLDTDCDCRATVLRVGRFGQWKKSVLVHEAYNDTEGAVNALLCM